MRLFPSVVAVLTLSLGYQVLGSRSSLAQTPDCKTVTDPATRLTCYDKINPPIATYPIPLPKPTARPLSMPQTSESGSTSSPGEEDAAMIARMNGICRGC